MTRFLHSKFFRNASWMVGGRIFQMAISLFIGIFTNRYLGPANYGIMSYVASYISFFTIICGLGLNGIIIKKFIQHPGEEGTYIFTAIVMRLSAGVISSIALQVLMATIHPNDRIILIVTALSSLSLLFSAFDIVNYWYQSRLQSKTTVLLSTAAYVVVAIYKIAILIYGKDVAWFAFSSSLDVVLVGIFLLLSYYKNKGPAFSFSWVAAKSMISQSYHFIFSGILVVVFVQTDKIMIGQFLGITQVGLYAAATTICGLWSFVPCAIIDSARPVIMEEKKRSEVQYVKYVKRLYCTLIWLSIVYGLLICIFAKPIILILYGSKYIAAVTPLRIAIWNISFSFLGMAKNIWLICENKQRFEKWFTLGGALINVGLNLIMIPWIGIEGAAIATFITQMTVNFILPAIVKDTRDSSKYMVDALLFRFSEGD